MIFYDTCSLLNQYTDIFSKISVTPFAISNITLKEIEEIKTSKVKDEEIKNKAKKLSHLLNIHYGEYKIINYEKDWDELINSNPILLPNNNDSKIIITALQYEDLSVFITDDLNCANLAKSLGITVKKSIDKEKDIYTGYRIIPCYTDNDMAQVYEQIYSQGINLLENQYCVLAQDDKYIDAYVKRDGECIQIPFTTCKSKMFGEVKPLDIFQRIALDSLKNNQLTMLRGSAGTGKSYLALGYLFSCLDSGKISKIIIFCNTVATAGSAKLGYYPGSRTEKLLDSQIGNFLISKLGDRTQVERMISDGTLLLLPLSDIRGFDTTGMDAGIYITEAQNLDVELMKLALQRIGNDSICILDGDSETQVDLNIYAGSRNGMRRVSEVFRGTSLYGEVTLPICHRSKIAEIAEKM